MTVGVLGQADLAATTNTLVYTAATQSAIHINILNRNASATTVRVAIGTISGSTPTNSNYIEYDASIPGNAVLERSGIILNAGQKVVVYAGATGITASVYGIET